MLDSTASEAPRGAPEPPVSDPGTAGSGGFDAALRSLANLDSQAALTFQGAANLNDLLRLATGHLARLVDAASARIWLTRRNGRRLVAREFPDEGRGDPIERRQARGDGLAGWAVTHLKALRLGPDDPRPALQGAFEPFKSAVVIRIVDQAKNSLELSDIGFYPDDLSRAKRYCERPQGILLVTGPTGSGKSTLLYAALRHIQHETKNIVTVEDPVEYQIPGLNQVQVDEKAKKTFATALRAILRQDPDVIMIGEIRDHETAQIAFRASVTGHFVLSTIHTNDAPTAVTRLVDMGLQPFMVASSLVAVISMRLVRTLCQHCKEPYEASASNLDRLGAAGRAEGKITLWRGRGCARCHQTGYHGRTGIFEVLDVGDTIRKQIISGAADSAIRAAAVEAGMRSIGEDGLKKVMEGRTTLEEVTRVIYLADATARICPSCSTVLNQEFEYCPACGDWVGEHCEGCRRRLTPGWTYCPFCGRGSTDQREAQVLQHPGRERRQKRATATSDADAPQRRAS